MLNVKGTQKTGVGFYDWAWSIISPQTRFVLAVEISKRQYDLPQGNRGHWVDAQTFMLEHDEIANNDHILFLIQFAGDRVILEGQETGHELGISIEGRMES
jgi:hypothetical protein